MILPRKKITINKNNIANKKSDTNGIAFFIGYIKYFNGVSDLFNLSENIYAQ